MGLIFSSYPFVNNYLYIKYDKFNNYDAKRKNYITKNFIKSYILFYLTVVTIPFIPMLFFGFGKINKCIHFIGFLYTSGDTVALLKNMNMDYSTKIHHTLTTSLGLINIFINWENANDVAKLMAVYMVLSCYSYDVNYCLSMRFLTNEFEQKIMKKRAFIIYMTCCAINWSIHGIYLIYNIKNLNFSLISYYSAIFFIVYDDIVLLKWLRN